MESHQHTANDSTMVLQVEGMTCTNCALGVTKTLEGAGLKQVHADFATGEVSYEDTGVVNFDFVVSKIEGLGYKVKTTAPGADAKPSRQWSIQTKFYFSLAFTVPLMLHMVFPHTAFINNPWVQFGLSLPVVLLGIWHFGRSAFHSLKAGVPNMDVLIFIGFSAAFGYSLWGTLAFDIHTAHHYLFYETAASIITLVLLGNLLEHRATQQTATAVKELGKIQNTIARKVVFVPGGDTLVEVPNSDIFVGDLLQVNTGDRIPADGIVTTGIGTVDESVVTGESMPVEKGPKDGLVGGTVLTSGSLRMQARAVGSQTVVSAIVKMVKEAQRSKPSIQRLGDRVSAVFVPVVVAVSALTFVLAFWAFSLPLQQSLLNAIAVLVISCPCAMGLATPTAVMAGIGRAAKNGIFIKGGKVLEDFAKIKTVVFDKTGTLTTGQFTLENIALAEGVNRTEVVDVLVALERQSSHPIAQSVVAALGKEAQFVKLDNVREEKGLGMQGYIGADFYQLGSEKLLPSTEPNKGLGANLYLLKNSQLIATISIDDTLKPDAADLVSYLHSMGIQTVLLSGDTQERTAALASRIGIDTVYAQKTPAEKLEIIKTLSAQSPTAMVGDGVNDAPALSAAHIGISISGATQAAMASSAIVLSNKENLAQLVLAHKVARHTLLTIKQNLFWAFFYNVIAIPIAAIGLLNPMIAAGSMAFSDVVVIGNSIRLKGKKIL